MAPLPTALWALRVGTSLLSAAFHACSPMFPATLGLSDLTRLCMLIFTLQVPYTLGNNQLDCTSGSLRRVPAPSTPACRLMCTLPGAGLCLLIKHSVHIIF